MKRIILIIGLFFVIFSFVYIIFNSLKTPDLKFCEKISSVPLRKICDAVALKNMKLCESVFDKGTCYDFVVDALKVSEKLCKGMPSPAKELCYHRLAVETKNPKFCEDNYDCHLAVAFAAQNQTVCGVFEGENRYYCLALATRNTSLCNEVGYDVDMENCKFRVPAGLNDCKRGEGFDDFCLFNLATAFKNSTLCNDLSPNLKIECSLEVENKVGTCETLDGHMKDFCLLVYFRNKVKTHD